MSNQNHTAEPWEAISPCPGECCWHLQQVGNDNPMDLISNPEMSRADALRIVACVNACAGIDTKYLESPDNLATYARRMAIQRGELLAALEDIEPHVIGEDNINFISLVISKAEASL